MERIIGYINKDLWDKAINEIEDINEEIIDGNNIIHIACIRGKEDIINKIKGKVNMNKGNTRGETCLHLLLRYGLDKIARKIYKEYPELLNLIDNEGRTAIIWTVDRINILEEMIDYIIEKKMTRIFDMITFNYRTLLLDIIDKTGDERYIPIIRKILKYANTNIPKYVPPLHYSIIKGGHEIVKMIIKNKGDVRIKDNRYFEALNIACERNDIKNVKILLKNGADISYGGLENDYLPVNIAINNGREDILEILYKYIKDFTIIDRYMNLYVHNLLNKVIKGWKINNKIIQKIVNKSNINKENIENITPLQLIIKINDSKILEEKIIINEKNEKNEESISLSPNTPINSISSTYIYGLFNSDIIHNIIYTLYILKKYNNITCPYKKITKEEYENDNRQIELQNISIDDNYDLMYEIISTYYKYFDYLTPYIIIWRNKYMYYIHPEFKKYLKMCFENNNKRFIIIKITLISNSRMAHANIVIIDKKNYDVRRFEPYGISDILDEYYLDKMISEYIKQIIKRKFKYIRPGDYLSEAKFQTISNDTFSDDKKLGDPMGYCLAWCFWYIELKINNPDIEEKKLIKKALEEIKLKYNQFENPYLMFIREYGKELDMNKNNILKSIGVINSKLYNIDYKEEILLKISKYIEEVLLKQNSIK